MLAVLALIANAVEAGAFPGAPTEKRGDRQFDACRTCDFDVLCPVTRERQWVRKSGDPAVAPVLALMNAEVSDDLEGAVVDGFGDVGSAAVSAVHDDEARASIELDLDSTLVVVAGSGHGQDDRPREPDHRAREERGRHAARDRGDHLHRGAAAELRQRIRARIEESAAEHPDDARLVAARQEVDEAAICTLHAFAQRILIEHSVAAGIPPGFDVLDETAERADFDARFEHFADTLLADPDAEPALVQGFSIGLTRDDLVEIARALHRHWDRLEDGGLVVLEQMRPAPGRWPATDPRPVLAAIDAALAMSGWCTDDRDRLKEHLDALAVVRAAAGVVVTTSRPRCDSSTALKSLRNKYGQQANWSGHIDEVRAASRPPRRRASSSCGPASTPSSASSAARLAHFVMAVADARRVEGRLGFHDLLVHARRLLRNDLGRGASLRRRYRRLLIDEFQDTDPIQVELAARIAATVDGSATWATPRQGGLFVVGTPSSRSTGFAGPTSSCSRTLVASSGNRSCS